MLFSYLANEKYFIAWFLQLLADFYRFELNYHRGELNRYASRNCSGTELRSKISLRTNEMGNPQQKTLSNTPKMESRILEFMVVDPTKQLDPYNWTFKAPSRISIQRILKEYCVLSCSVLEVTNP